MKVTISAHRIFLMLFGIISFLTLASFTGHMIHMLTGHDTIFGLRQLFDMNGELNIPAWYSATALFATSLLLLGIYFVEKGNPDSPRFNWLFLSLVFQFLAYDEAFSVHEGLWRMGHNFLVDLNMSYFTWILPAMVLVTLVFAVSFHFLFRLESNIRRLMMVSGAIYVGGAAFVEELCHLRRDALTTSEITDPLYIALSTCEEFMEMFGIALFIFALLRHLEQRYAGLVLEFAASGSRDGTTLSKSYAVSDKWEPIK